MVKNFIQFFRVRVSKSLLKETPYEQKSMDPVSQPVVDFDCTTNAVQTRLDMFFSSGLLVDVPHLRMYVKVFELKFF